MEKNALARGALLIVSSAFVLLSGCTGSSPGGFVDIDIQLVFGSEIRAELSTFLPGVDLEITDFAIAGSGPDGDTFAASANAEVCHIESVAPGLWEISATGTNSDGEVIVVGTTTAEIGTDQTDVHIELDLEPGAGGLLLDVHVPADLAGTHELSAVASDSDHLTYELDVVSSGEAASEIS